MASKGIAESNVNPVAPALANALHDATGVRTASCHSHPSAFTAVSIENRLTSAT